MKVGYPCLSSRSSVTDPRSFDRRSLRLSIGRFARNWSQNSTPCSYIVFLDEVPAFNYSLIRRPPTFTAMPPCNTIARSPLLILISSCIKNRWQKHFEWPLSTFDLRKKINHHFAFPPHVVVSLNRQLLSVYQHLFSRCHQFRRVSHSAFLVTVSSPKERRRKLLVVRLSISHFSSRNPCFINHFEHPSTSRRINIGLDIY